MKHEIDPRGPDDLVPSDEELLGLFERRRPSADAFADRVKARIAEREAEVHGEAREKTAGASEWSDGFRSPDGTVAPMAKWSRVAALLPLKSAGLKAIPAALAWPLLLLIATMSGFYYGRRSLSDSLEERGPDGAAEQEVETWPHGSRGDDARLPSSMKWLGALVFGGPVVVLVFGGSWAVEILLGLLCLLMLGLALAVRDLASKGGLERKDVAQVTAIILMGALVSGALMGSKYPGAAAHVGPGRGWAFVALVLGVVACFSLGGSTRKARGFALWGVVCVVLLNPFCYTSSSRASIASQLKSSAEDLRVEEPIGWEQAATLHTALVDTGAETPDLGDLARRVSEKLLSEETLNALTIGPAVDMGLISTEHLLESSLGRGHMTERVMAAIEDRVAGGNSSRIWLPSIHKYRVELLAASGGLDERSREGLTELVLDHWPAIGEFQALRAALDCVHWLDALGRDDKIESLRQRAYELLSRYWMSKARTGFLGDAGGFMAQPGEHQFSSTTTTLEAVELMARFGIPDAVDPFLVRGYLRQEASTLPLFFMFHSYLKADARAALLRLESQVGMPRRTWFEWILAQRLFIVSFLLALLCILAVWMAPRSVEQILEDEVGALP